MIELPVFGILMPIQMLMRAIAHGSNTNTVRESALKADCERERERKKEKKTPQQQQLNLPSRGIEPVSALRWIFYPTLYQLSLVFDFNTALRPETVRTIRDWETRTSTSTFTQLLSSDWSSPGSPDIAIIVD